MLLRRMKEPKQAVFSAAMFCLAFGGIISWLLRRDAPPPPFWDHVGDGMMGMFYGMAIALVFVAARLKARGNSRVC